MVGRSHTLSVIYDMHDPCVERGESSSQRQAQGRVLLLPLLLVALLAADDASFIFTVGKARCLPVCPASASHSNLLRFRAHRSCVMRCLAVGPKGAPLPHRPEGADGKSDVADS